MALIPNELKLEKLLENIPKYPAVITETTRFFVEPIKYFINFKYDNLDINCELMLSRSYALALMNECNVKKFSDLEGIPIIVYTQDPKINDVYAICTK